MARRKRVEKPEPAPGGLDDELDDEVDDVRCRFPQRCWRCGAGPLADLAMLCAACGTEDAA